MPSALEGDGGRTSGRSPVSHDLRPRTVRPESLRVTSSVYVPGSTRIVSSVSAASAADCNEVVAFTTRTARYSAPSSRSAALACEQTRQSATVVAVFPQASSAPTAESGHFFCSLARNFVSAFASFASRSCSAGAPSDAGARQRVTVPGVPHAAFRALRQPCTSFSRVCASFAASLPIVPWHFWTLLSELCATAPYS